jgi:hypothetical protein
MFIMERNRYDGVDVAHLLLATADRLDWQRLLSYLDEHWRVLLSHLLLFGFIYPSERTHVPEQIMHQLVQRLQQEFGSASPSQRLCQGTLLSHTDYRIDIELWGYQDARVQPVGTLTEAQAAHQTATLSEESSAS